MANNIIKRIWNQNKMVNIEALQGMAFQAEDGGHTFQISGIDDTGASVALSGTVAGVFRRADNADIALTGSASDGKVSVTLTEDCYAVPGRFALTIFVTADSKKTAVYAAVGTVAFTSGGVVAGSTPQDVVDLINAINAAVATIPASYSGLMADIAPTYSNSALYTVGQYVYYNGDLYRCTTAITTAESWTAAHWTVATFGSDVADLKSAFEDFQDDIHNDLYTHQTVEKDILISSKRNSGFISANGTVSASDSYVYSQRIAVAEGDTITGTGVDSNYGVTIPLTMQKICAYSSGTAVEAKGSNSAVTTYTVPSGIDEIVVSYLARMTDVVFTHHVLNYDDYTPIISEETIGKLLTVSQKTTVDKINPTVVDGKFVNKSGTVSTSASYYYFEVDNLNEGDIVAVRTFYGASTSIVIPYLRFVCAYNSAGNAVSNSGAENVRGSYTVPSGIVKIAISISASYPLESVIVFTSKDVTDVLVNDNLDSTAFASYPQSTSGELSASSTLSLTANAVKKNKDILFNGSISAFNQITIGQGTNDLNSSKIVIDTTNVTFYRGEDETGIASAHGLTFKDYLSITVAVDNDHIPTITIMTNGGKYSHTYNQWWVGCMRNIYATTDASTSFSSCVLSFVCRDIKEPLWIFGDSYVSYTGERWTYWISKMGFNGYLLNGYSGEDSPNAMIDFRNLLAIGTPKYLVWALGMNDADQSSAVNNKWVAVYNELKALCNANNITLILCTIPNVPTRNHSSKNEIVRESGYKYIDFASAVGAAEDTTWYDGMLSIDGVHPTEQGAYALASEVIKDFPYICL